MYFIYILYSHRDIYIYRLVLHVCNVFVYLRYEYTSYTHIVDSWGFVCFTFIYIYINIPYIIYIYIITMQLYNVYIVVIYKSNAISMVPRIQRSSRPSPPVQLRTLLEGRCRRRRPLGEGFACRWDNWAYPVDVRVLPWYLLCSTLGFLGIITHKYPLYKAYI